jgi:ABC-type transport system substrate-binding protein
MQAVYGANAIPPAGFNVPYWSPATGSNYYNYRAQESDDLIRQINTNLNLTQARLDLYEWQEIWYDAMTNVIIYNQYEVHAVGKGVYGYEPTGYPFSAFEDFWVDDTELVDPGTADTIVLAASTGGDTFNSILATDVYDQYSAGAVLDGLVGNAPSNEFVLPAGTNRTQWMLDNYGTTTPLALYPRIATAMGTYSADGLQYNISLKEDVYWHDGEVVDAWDVAFSFQARLIPAIGSSQYSNLIVPFGTDDKAAMSGNYSFVVEDKDDDDHYEFISFQLASTFAPFETDYLGSSLFPEHILGDDDTQGFDTNGDFDISLWDVAPGDWDTHSFNTGRPTDTGGLKGPIGCGPIFFKEFDSVNSKITMEKFEDIQWDNDSGDWVDATGISHWNIDNLDDMPEQAVIIVALMDSALADMKSGSVHVMDPQFTMANIYEELVAEDAINPVLLPETGWQSIYMNPKFTPDGTDFPFQKKGVHHAISHVVPRQDIITYLMNGLGLPGYTPVPITSWAAMPEADFLEFKKGVTATDGSKPEENATTAYDAYSRNDAFNWLESEDYNMDDWRDYHAGEWTPPATGTPGFEIFFAAAAVGAVALYIKRKRR